LPRASGVSPGHSSRSRSRPTSSEGTGSNRMRGSSCRGRGGQAGRRGGRQQVEVPSQACRCVRWHS
jgi:hypothetical protein